MVSPGQYSMHTWIYILLLLGSVLKCVRYSWFMVLFMSSIPFLPNLTICLSMFKFSFPWVCWICCMSRESFSSNLARFLPLLVQISFLPFLSILFFWDCHYLYFVMGLWSSVHLFNLLFSSYCTISIHLSWYLLILYSSTTNLKLSSCLSFHFSYCTFQLHSFKWFFIIKYKHVHNI